MEKEMKKSFLMTSLLFTVVISASDSHTSSGVGSPTKHCREGVSLEVSVASLVLSASEEHATIYNEAGERFNAFEDLCGRCPHWVNRKHDGTTALHQAARAGRLDNVRVLLGWSANTNVIDAQKQTPLHVALLAGHDEIADELKRYGASERFSESYLKLPQQKIILPPCSDK